MPISNPLLTINVAEAPPPMAVLQPRDPDITPNTVGTFWLNTISDRLFVAKATNSQTDWAIVTADGGSGSADIATILGAIVVANGSVLTDGTNVIFED